MSLPTTLRHAICSNEPETIRAELTAHPDTNLEQLDACLVLAMPQGHEEIIKLLLQLGAQPDHESTHAAIEREDPSILQLLVESGWDMDTTKYGRTPLHNALYHQVSLRWLLSHGADPNIKAEKYTRGGSGSDHTPMAEAAMLSDPAPLLILLSHGATLDPEAIFHAIGKRRSDNGTATLETLIENGADVNFFSKRWLTPLYRAVYVNDETKLRLLLKHGADPTFQTGARKLSPLDFARNRKNERLAAILEGAERRAMS